MSHAEPTSSRRRVLKSVGLTGILGLSGATGLSLLSQPALAISEPVTLPSGLVEGSVTVESYEIQYANLETSDPIEITYILTVNGTLQPESEYQSFSFPISTGSGSLQTGDHTITIPTGEIGLQIQLSHPSLSQDSITSTNNATTVSSGTSVIDNFDLSPNGIWQSGQTVPDIYQGDTGSYNLTTTESINNGRSLVQTSGVGADRIYNNDGSLPTYIQPGDTVSWYTKGDTSLGSYKGDARFCFFFADSNNYALARTNFGNDVTLEEVAGGTRTVRSTGGVTLQTDTWYESVLTIETGGSVTYELYEVDNSGTRQTQVASFSADYDTTATYWDADGIAIVGNQSRWDGIETV